MATVNDPLAHNGELNRTHDGGIKDKLSQATSHVKHTASEFGRSASENINRNLQSAAGALENASSALRSRLPDDRSGTMTGVAYTAADKMEATARYLRTHDTNDLVHGVESWTRRNPGAALASAVALGFCIGYSLQRDRRS